VKLHYEDFEAIISHPVDPVTDPCLATFHILNEPQALACAVFRQDCKPHLPLASARVGHLPFFLYRFPGLFSERKPHLSLYIFSLTAIKPAAL